MNARHVDEADVNQIVDRVVKRFGVDDDAWVAQGHDAIAGAWSDEAMRSSITLVTTTCADHPEQTLDQRADAVFDGFAALETSLGARR